LASLKTKDPAIYQTETKFFSDKEIVPPKKSKEEEKAMFLRDYERKMIVEKGGKFSDEEEEQGPSGIKTYTKEQDDLKKDFRKALVQSDSEDEDLLTIRKKTDMEKVFAKYFTLFRLLTNFSYTIRKKKMMNTKNG
jgi:protein KRI1